jgi:glucokinase
MSRLLALDLGGTNLRAGVADAAAPAKVDIVGRWPAPAGLAAFEVRLRELVETHDPARIGIAIPGLATGTTCTWVPNLPWLDGVDLAAILPGLPLALGNDAQLSLLAEATDGAAAGLGDAILLAIGTGIGSAVLSGGRVVRGARGGATSFGWACADPSDTGDARDGWLERNASGRAFDRLAVSIGLADGARLIEEARAGNTLAQRLLDGPATALGSTLAGAVSLLDVRAVVLAGGVTTALDVLEPRIMATLRRQLPPHLRDVALVAGQFGAGAALAGAAVAAAGSPFWEDRK